MSDIKLIIKIFWVQIFYFVLQFCLKPMFHTPCHGCERVFYVQSNMEIILEIALFLGLSVGMCYFILKTKRMIVTSFLMGIPLWVLFELTKYIEYLTGYLPHYGDVPVVIGFVLSLVVMAAYMGMLYLTCVFIKRVILILKRRNK